MCGILGVYSKQGACIVEQQFADALHTMLHRGPDAQKMIHTPPLQLGFVRLSILDLSPAAIQPFYSNTRRSVIIFNGEIYNYQALKQELCTDGYHFHTKSDTEVLLALYEQVGIEQALKKLNGMFAFAIFDFQLKILYVARDHFGIKPLYYFTDENFFSFASEPRALLKLHPQTKKLNLKAVSSYLSYRYPILEDSFFEGIKVLSPGTYLQIQGNSIQKFSYWNLAEHFVERAASEAELVAQLDELLANAVYLQKQADVKVGAFLSGGVDSSLITAYAAGKGDALQTFSVGFAEESFDESSYASEVAKQFPNVEHHTLVLSAEAYWENLQYLIRLKGAPLSVPNEVPLYMLAKTLKKSVGVVLSGEGADEIFGGYGRIFRSSYDLYRRRQLDQLPWEDWEKREFIKKFSLKYPHLTTLNPLAHFLSIYPYTSFLTKQRLLSSELDVIALETDLDEKINAELNTLHETAYPTQMLYAFIKLHLPGLLGRIDFATMAASLEARVPFLDCKVVEFAASIPYNYKLRWQNYSKQVHTLMSDEISEVYDVPKYILKRLGERYLPHSVVYRKKMGFPLPIAKWFTDKHLGWTREVLLSTPAKSRGIYNVPFLEKALTQNNTLLNTPFTIWALINLELFCQNYFNGE